MEIWKTLRVSHIPTPPAAATDKCLTRRYTNTPLGTKDRSGQSEGHFNGNAAKDQHTRALTDSGVQRFEPYILRHTALTNLAKKGADAHTLARIAGHSSIVITMRYVHPQADAIERAFASAHGKVSRKRASQSERGKLPAGTKQSEVGTKMGTIQIGEKIHLLSSGQLNPGETSSGQGI
jgi:hypothetical protein